MMVVPGEDRALEVLTADECWRLIATSSVGRFAVNRQGAGPLVVPVNYVVDEDSSLVFKSGPGAKLDAVGHGVAVMQVDDIDPVRHTGWSVMVEGTTNWLYDDQDRTEVEPWAPGARPYVVRLTPARVSGRRIHLPQTDTDGRGYR
jgi:nitroimidazol reductase NimA-like FMN-containing flavoprotein (pyridoxamine 5'-phosphate oxidase superfamily)